MGVFPEIYAFDQISHGQAGSCIAVSGNGLVAVVGEVNASRIIILVRTSKSGGGASEGWTTLPSQTISTAAVGSPAGFGECVSVSRSGDTIAATADGKVFIFRRTPGGPNTWHSGADHVEVNLLDTSPITSVAVSPDGNKVAYGSPTATFGSNAEAGRAGFIHLDAEAAPPAVVAAHTAIHGIGADYNYGASIAFLDDDGERAAFGAPGRPLGSGTDVGAVSIGIFDVTYTFIEALSIYSELWSVGANDGPGRFGEAVAASDEFIAVGTPGHGLVEIFDKTTYALKTGFDRITRSGGTVAISDPGTSRFGAAIAIDPAGERVFVGEPDFTNEFASDGRVVCVDNVARQYTPYTRTIMDATYGTAQPRILNGRYGSRVFISTEDGGTVLSVLAPGTISGDANWFILTLSFIPDSAIPAVSGPGGLVTGVAWRTANDVFNYTATYTPSPISANVVVKSTEWTVRMSPPDFATTAEYTQDRTISATFSGTHGVDINTASATVGSILTADCRCEYATPIGSVTRGSEAHDAGTDMRIAPAIDIAISPAPVLAPDYLVGEPLVATITVAGVAYTSTSIFFLNTASFASTIVADGAGADAHSLVFNADPAIGAFDLDAQVEYVDTLAVGSPTVTDATGAATIGNNSYTFNAVVGYGLAISSGVPATVGGTVIADFLPTGILATALFVTTPDSPGAVISSPAAPTGNVVVPIVPEQHTITGDITIFGRTFTVFATPFTPASISGSLSIATNPVGVTHAFPGQAVFFNSAPPATLAGGALVLDGSVVTYTFKSPGNSEGILTATSGTDVEKAFALPNTVYTIEVTASYKNSAVSPPAYVKAYASMIVETVDRAPTISFASVARPSVKSPLYLYEDAAYNDVSAYTGGGPTTESWAFGDGGVSGTTAGTYAYTDPAAIGAAAYTLSRTVTIGHYPVTGHASVSPSTLTNTCPIAIVTFPAPFTCANTPVLNAGVVYAGAPTVFMSTTAIPPAATATTWFWSIAGGAYVSSATDTYTTTLEYSGDYTVSHYFETTIAGTVVTSETETATKTVLSATEAACRVVPTRPWNPVIFSDASLKPGATSVSWDFGDGTPAIVVPGAMYSDIEHTYTMPGVYTVTLTHTYSVPAGGSIDVTSSKIVRIPTAIVVKFPDSPIPAFSTALFDTAVIDDPVSVVFDFGNGRTRTIFGGKGILEIDAGYIYSTPGVYTASVSATWATPVGGTYTEVVGPAVLTVTDPAPAPALPSDTVTADTSSIIVATAVPAMVYTSSIVVALVVYIGYSVYRISKSNVLAKLINKIGNDA